MVVKHTGTLSENDQNADVFDVGVRDSECEHTIADLSAGDPCGRIILRIHTPQATITLPPAIIGSSDVYVHATVPIARIRLLGAVHKVQWSQPGMRRAENDGNAEGRLTTSRSHTFMRTVLLSPDAADEVDQDDAIVFVGGRWRQTALPRPACPHGVLFFSGTKLPATLKVTHHHRTIIAGCTGMKRLAARTYGRFRLIHRASVIDVVGNLRELKLDGAGPSSMELSGQVDRVEVKNASGLRRLALESAKSLNLENVPGLVSLSGMVGTFTADADSMTAPCDAEDIQISLRPDSKRDVTRALRAGRCGRLAAYMRWMRRTPADDYNAMSLCWQLLPLFIASTELTPMEILELGLTIDRKNRARDSYAAAIGSLRMSLGVSPSWRDTRWDLLIKLYQRDPAVLASTSPLWSLAPDPVELGTVAAWLVADTESANPRLRFCRAWLQGCYQALSAALAKTTDSSGAASDLSEFADDDYAHLIHGAWHNLVELAARDPWMADHLDAWLDLLPLLTPPLTALPVAGTLIQKEHPRATAIWKHLAQTALDSVEPDTPAAIEVARMIVAQQVAARRTAQTGE